MPHAILPFACLLLLPLLRSRIHSGVFVYWILVATGLSATVVNLFVFASESQFSWALFGLLTFLGPSLFYFLAVQLNPVEKRLMLDLIAAAVALSVATGLPLYFFDIPIFSDSIDVSASGYRINTILGNPLSQAGICLMVLPWLAARLKETPNLIRALLVIMTLLGIVLSGSRVIIPLALIFICAHFIRNIASFSRSGFTAAAVVMFGLSIVPVITQIIPQMWAPIERILSSSDDTAGSSLARVESVVTALRLVAERPVFGHGPGQIYAWSRVPEGQLAADKVLVLDQGLTLVEPHSFPMIIAVEYGLLTLIMFGAMMLAVIWQWYLNEGSKANKTIPASIVGICLFSVQSVGSSDIAIMPHVAMIFWIWCGCCTILQSGSLASVDGRVRA